MTFSHPLARSARVFTARNNDGGEYRVLSIVTTLELDAESHDYKKNACRKALQGCHGLSGRFKRGGCIHSYEQTRRLGHRFSSRPEKNFTRNKGRQLVKRLQVTDSQLQGKFFDMARFVANLKSCLRDLN